MDDKQRALPIGVSVRPAPKGGCGPNWWISSSRSLCLSEARPEGRVWLLTLTSHDQWTNVSVRPAPKGGCGAFKSQDELRTIKSQ